MHPDDTKILAVCLVAALAAMVMVMAVALPHGGVDEGGQEPASGYYTVSSEAYNRYNDAYVIELWLDKPCYDDRFDIMIDGEWYASYPPVRQDEWSYHYKISWLMHPGTDCGSITLRYPGHQLVRL